MLKMGSGGDLLGFALAEVPTDCISMGVDEEERDSGRLNRVRHQLDRFGRGFGILSFFNSRV
jgi:hypothetical protein